MVNEFGYVSFEKLLGRNLIAVDVDDIRRDIGQRRIMVTGAAGSIGSELCRQILGCAPSRLVCVDRAETALFHLQQELQSADPDHRINYAMRDVGDPIGMRRLLFEHRPEVLFHAAAYKHVSMVELNPLEAVNNNVLGVVSLLEVAEGAGTERFMLISSDKAVNPTSIMGATKRICELVVCSRPSVMRCTSVRFGNVLGSSGSVVPVLLEQLYKGRPLTITHPGMKRYFMTIHEAAGLVLEATVIGRAQDILVLDMGEPMLVTDLASCLIRLSGKSERDVKIEFTGAREGEKLEEELFYAEESRISTAHVNIKCAVGTLRSWQQLSQQLEELRADSLTDGAAAVRAKIKEIVPEYYPPGANHAPVSQSSSPPATQSWS